MAVKENARLDTDHDVMSEVREPESEPLFRTRRKTATHEGACSGRGDSGPSLRAEDLYEEFFPLVWRSLRALGVPATLLDDAAQDVFLVVHRQLAGFRAESSPRTWLFGIAHRVAANYRRRERRKGGLVPLDSAMPSESPDPEAHVRGAQAWGFLRNFLDGLDEGKRAVFVMTQIEGMTAAEAAEALQIPVNTVYTRLHHTRARFRAALANYPEEDPDG